MAMLATVGVAEVLVLTKTDGSALSTLEGAAVSGRVYVFVPQAPLVWTMSSLTSMTPVMTRTPYRVGGHRAVDMVGGTETNTKPLDTATLATGPFE